MERPEERRKNAIDDLLSTGVWTSRRPDSISSTPTPRPRIPSRAPSPFADTNNTGTRPTNITNHADMTSRAKSPRPLQKAPPRPIVEDELDALAGEVTALNVNSSILNACDPPMRGTVDQQPIILESEVSAADAAKLHTKINAELKDELRNADSGERRFVLVPQPDSHSVDREADNERARRTHTEPKDKKTASRGDKQAAATPPLERRKSRQDLPALETNLGAEAPPFRRSTSAYAYTPTSNSSAKTTTRPVAADFLLSPEAVLYKGQGKGKGSFDVPISTPRQRSVGGPLDRASAPVDEKRRSGGSRPNTPPTATPVAEKRTSTGYDGFGRVKYENGDKLVRPHQLSAENGTLRPKRNTSGQPERMDTMGDFRKPSMQSNKGYYTASDSDLADSSDSEKEKSKGHRRHKHYRAHESSLRPNGARDRHERSASTRSAVETRRSGRHASPLPSPQISPNQLPPVDRRETLRDNYATSRNSRKTDSQPNSRPVSPNALNETAIPSASRLDINSNQKGARQSSPAAVSGSKSGGTSTSSTLPMPIPARIDLHSPGDTRRTPNIPKYDDDSRSTGATSSSKPFWQPPSFQPLDSQYLDQPVGSYRRYSQDIEEGNIAPLPPCPRIAPVAGYNDWLTLPGCPSFNICPTCFKSTMAPTAFKNHFVLAPIRSAKEKIACDFGSQPWYRIAWLLTRKEHRRDLDLIYQLAEVSENSPLCIGKNEAVRKWHSVPDPANGAPIRNFDVCIHCVKSIEVLLPDIKGVFVRTDHLGPPGIPRVCDMRFDSKRFIHYFDALETMADISFETRHPPNPRAFAALVQNFATLPECQLDATIQDARWYMITQLPEFTICPECFEEVVVPGLRKKKAIPMLFAKDMKRVEGGASCQLYSPKMREAFAEAVEANDYKMLAAMARDRRAAEEKWKRGGVRAKDAEREWKRLE